MSCKSRGKESEIESVQSHQETSELIEKGVKYFSRTRTGKRPAIYFKIAASGTESKKNLKVIYRQIEPLHLAQTGSYHSGAWIATIIMPIVIDAVRKPSYISGLPPVFLDFSSLFPLLFSLPPLYQKEGEPVGTDPQRWRTTRVVTFQAPQAVWHTHRQLRDRVLSHRVLLPNPVFLHSRLSSRSPVFSTP